MIVDADTCESNRSASTSPRLRVVPASVTCDHEVVTTPDGVAETVINSEAMAWIPLGDGEWFKPLGFGPGGWRRLLLRLSPGTVVARHRHRGEVHAFNVAGHRQIVGRDEIIGPGGYVYEPAGNIDTWSCVGTEDCVVSIIVAGAMEYLDDEDRVIASDDTASLRATYLRWCAETGTEPDPRLDITPHRVR